MINSNRFCPDSVITFNKTKCLSKLFKIKFREIFKQRYKFYNGGQEYKCDPLHGELIVESLGDTFNSLDTDEKAAVKSGNIDNWNTKVLCILLSQVDETENHKLRIEKENEIIDKFYKYETCELYTPTNESLDSMISLLLDLYKINGDGDCSEQFTEEDIKFRLETDQSRIPGGYRLDIDKENQIQLLKEQGNKLFNEKNYSKAIDTYTDALAIGIGFNISFKTISTLLVNRSMAHFEFIKKSTNVGSKTITAQVLKPIKERCIKDCKEALAFTPSWSRPYMKLSYYTSIKGTYKAYQLALIYGSIALLFEPNNLKYHATMDQFQILSKQRLSVIEVKESVTGLPIGYYENIGRDHIESNKHQLVTKLQFIPTDKLKSIEKLIEKSISLNNQRVKEKRMSDNFIKSLEYYKQAHICLENGGSIELAFKLFWNSIIVAGGDGENTDICSDSFNWLGKMYEFGNSYVKVNVPLALTMYYTCSLQRNGKKYGCHPKVAAMFSISRLYYNGYEVDRDLDKSIYWLKLSTEIETSKNDEMGKSEIGNSLFAFGDILYNGQKRLCNKDEAMKLWKKGFEVYNDKHCFNHYTNALKLTDQTASNLLKR